MRQEPPSQHRPSTRVAPRRIIINGRPTSIRLEPNFWQWLREIAFECGLSTKALIEGIYAAKDPRWPLTSALRLRIAEYFRNRVGPHYYVDLDYGTRSAFGRRPRSQQSPGVSNTSRPPRPKAA
jgi:predicted DNA-binding ribbon-helix-helix protein